MRINNIANIYDSYALSQANSRIRHNDAINGSDSKRDSIEVSSSARCFTAALQAIANAPDIREDLVSNVRAQIESGTYVADASKIADKLLAQ